MILKAEIIKQIQTGKRSMIRLPVKEKTCKYRPGRVYEVKEGQKAPIKLHITITDIRQEQHDDRLVWVLRFQKGDHTDSDRLPAARFGPSGDYVSTTARALQGSAAEDRKSTRLNSSHM